MSNKKNCIKGKGITFSRRQQQVHPSHYSTHKKNVLLHNYDIVNTEYRKLFKELKHLVTNNEDSEIEEIVIRADFPTIRDVLRNVYNLLSNVELYDNRLFEYYDRELLNLHIHIIEIKHSIDDYKKRNINGSGITFSRNRVYPNNDRLHLYNKEILRSKLMLIVPQYNNIVEETENLFNNGMIPENIYNDCYTHYLLPINDKLKIIKNRLRNQNPISTSELRSNMNILDEIGEQIAYLKRIISHIN